MNLLGVRREEEGMWSMCLHKIALQGWWVNLDHSDDGNDDGDGGGDGVDDGGGGDEVDLVASQSSEERSVGVRRKRRVYVLPSKKNTNQVLHYHWTGIKVLKPASRPPRLQAGQEERARQRPPRPASQHWEDIGAPVSSGSSSLLPFWLNIYIIFAYLNHHIFLELLLYDVESK